MNHSRIFDLLLTQSLIETSLLPENKKIKTSA
jgi:hypothetical protein